MRLWHLARGQLNQKVETEEPPRSHLFKTRSGSPANGASFIAGLSPLVCREPFRIVDQFFLFAAKEDIESYSKSISIVNISLHLLRDPNKHSSLSMFHRPVCDMCDEIRGACRRRRLRCLFFQLRKYCFGKCRAGWQHISACILGVHATTEKSISTNADSCVFVCVPCRRQPNGNVMKSILKWPTIVRALPRRTIAKLSASPAQTA